MRRRRAIRLALKYGLLPWWSYENSPHYTPMTYWEHLWLNLVYAAVWLLRLEDDDDREFERVVNGKRA